VLFEIDIISLIAVLVFLAIGGLLVFFWQKSRPEPNKPTELDMWREIGKIQESTAAELIKNFKSLYDIIAMSELDFVDNVANLDIDKKTARTIYANFLAYVKRTKIIWIRKYQFVITLFFIIIVISGPVGFMNFLEIINSKPITPEMVMPKIGSNWDQVNLIQINFDGVIDQTQVKIKVFDNENQSITGSIDWWRLKAVRWTPLETIKKTGVYRVVVEGEKNNTAIFYFGITEKMMFQEQPDK
jgi:hypothetical protein